MDFQFSLFLVKTGGISRIPNKGAWGVVKGVGSLGLVLSVHPSAHLGPLGFENAPQKLTKLAKVILKVFYDCFLNRILGRGQTRGIGCQGRFRKSIFALQSETGFGPPPPPGYVPLRSLQSTFVFFSQPCGKDATTFSVWTPSGHEVVTRREPCHSRLS